MHTPESHIKETRDEKHAVDHEKKEQTPAQEPKAQKKPDEKCPKEFVFVVKNR